MRHLAAVLVAAAALAAPLAAGADDLASPVYANHMDAKSLTEYAAKLIADDHCAAALPFLQMAVEQDPGFAEAYLNLGIAYADLGRSDKSIESYERYLALNPHDPRAVDVEKIVAAYKSKEGEPAAKPVSATAQNDAAPAADQAKAVAAQN